MKIAGFTIIKNAVKNDYPIVEAIRSILPVVDTMIVLVGDCNDGTEELVRSIGSDKIRIHHSIWDPGLSKGGVVLAAETDKAFDLVGPEYDWAFYIQADECVHEQYHANIIEACKKYKDDKRVEGLLFNYLHFYGTFDYVGDSRKWYHKEVRIIRNDKSIRSYRDAQGFRKNGNKVQVKQIDAYIYHYGWVKSPEQMKEKIRNATSNYWTEYQDKPVSPVDLFDVNDYDSLVKFTGTHPSVMKERLEHKSWTIELDTTRKKFSLKDRILYWFEKTTGIRPFDFKNYKVI
nr:glycosyltransferase family 2 protein [Flavihumibacter rivuli]